MMCLRGMVCAACRNVINAYAKDGTIPRPEGRPMLKGPERASVKLRALMAYLQIDEDVAPLSEYEYWST